MLSSVTTSPGNSGSRPTRLVDMRAHDYRLEPNLTFTPDGRSIIFCSNMHGANHVYAVDLARAG